MATIPVASRKRLALVAHDAKKPALLVWASNHLGALRTHELYATGTTGRLLEEHLGVPVIKLLSGPIGGDQQLGSLIAEGRIDALIFFWDPLSAAPHDPDVKALLRLAVLWNIAVASNEITADHLFTSPLMSAAYHRDVPIVVPATAGLPVHEGTKA